MPYKFMWGQRQSAMITEVMFLALGAKGRILNTGIREDLSVLVNETYKNYMPPESISDWESNGKKYLNKNFVKELFKNIDNFIEEFYRFSNYIHKFKSKLIHHTNKQIFIIFQRYQSYMQDALNYFGSSTPAATKNLEEKIKSIISRRVHDYNLQQQIFIDLSTPAKLDETMKERISLLKLSEKDEITESYLLKFARSYPGLFFNTYSQKEIVVFLKNQTKQLQKKSKKEKELEIIRIKEYLKITNKKHDKIYSELKNVKPFALTLQRAALERYRLKHIWSGAEFLFLNLLNEISLRIGIKFSDFIKVYTFSDIVTFFENGKRLNNVEVRERKKCIVLHYINRKIYRHYGNKALGYINNLIKNQKTKTQFSEIIKGITANRGIVYGRARLASVKDLKHFSQYSKNFKKGDILVTTMTSPLMIPIIEKAKGIITDEGGICSHAAVSAREFKIPCVVGTHIASSIINTGDLIELDANMGVIRIVKKNLTIT